MTRTPQISRREFMLSLTGAGVSITFNAGEAAKRGSANDNGPVDWDAPPAGGGRTRLDRQSAFFDALGKAAFRRRWTPTQRAGIEMIIDVFAEVGDGRDKTLAYALATVAHETGFRMIPVREGFAKDDVSARRILRHKAYAQSVGPYGHAYYGRGIVQLTWKTNYQGSSKDAGVDLVANPDLALDPRIGARLLFLGLIDGRWNGSRAPHTGKGIAFYLPDHGTDDVRNARRTVNFLDKWQVIAGYYSQFLAAIRQSGLI